MKLLTVVSPGEITKIKKNLQFFNDLGLLDIAYRVSVVPRAFSKKELNRSCVYTKKWLLASTDEEDNNITRYSDQEKNIFAKQLIEISKKYNIDERDLKRKMEALIKMGGKIYHCTAGLCKISIVPDGSIYPCHQLVNIEKFKMGNVNSWKNNKVRYEKVQNCFKARNVFKISKCKTCIFQTICPPLVDCPARSYLEENSLYKTPQYCEIYLPYMEKIFYEFIKKAIKN